MLLVDTGGIEPKTDDIILSQMKAQAELAIDSADVIVFLCDVRAGLTADDREIAVTLKKSGKQTFLSPCTAAGRKASPSAEHGLSGCPHSLR